MKKQILIFAMLTLAIVFAGLKSYGQVDPDFIDAATTECVAAIPLGLCAADDALNPIPGQTYTYTLDVAPTVTAAGNITWFVYNATTVGDIITGGSIATALAAAEANDGTSQFLLLADAANYNTTSTSESIDVTWQSFDGSANEILLVAYVEGEDGCSDNIEVWRIEPTFAFTLDIAGLMPDGTLPTGNANECVSPVQEAGYDGTDLVMDYGENYVYFVVNAANFVHSWNPTFTVSSTGTAVDVTDVTWAYPDQAILNDGTVATGTWNAATEPILAVDASGAVGDDGECIVVRVYLDHGKTENDVASAVTLGVDGVMYNIPTTNYSNTGLTDLDSGDDTAPCSNTETDSAIYDLTPRPNITATDPTPFEPKN